jgi:hypothetical protein
MTSGQVEVDDDVVERGQGALAAPNALGRSGFRDCDSTTVLGIRGGIPSL